MEKLYDCNLDSDVDHLNTPHAVYDDQQQLRWKWDQAGRSGKIRWTRTQAASDRSLVGAAPR